MGYLFRHLITGEAEFEVFASRGCVNVHGTVFNNLDHLEGETVRILADGVVLEDQVVTGGSIVLSSSYGIVHVGLPYNSDIETSGIME